MHACVRPFAQHGLSRAGLCAQTGLPGRRGGAGAARELTDAAATEYGPLAALTLLSVGSAPLAYPQLNSHVSGNGRPSSLLPPPAKEANEDSSVVIVTIPNAILVFFIIIIFLVFFYLFCRVYILCTAQMIVDGKTSVNRFIYNVLTDF